MNDLIKREDAIKALKDSVVEMGGDDFCEMGVHTDDIEAVVNAIPSADTEIEIIKAEAYAKGIDSERKRISDWCRPQGEWIPSDSFDEWYGRTCECSVCGNEFLRFNFCPNCGSKMKGADDGNK